MTHKGSRGRVVSVAFGAVAAILAGRVASPQSVTGALIGTVVDGQGRVIRDADVRVDSPALLGGASRTMTNDKGQFRFPSLPPGVYDLTIESTGFTPLHEPQIKIGVGMTIERTAALAPGGVEESIVVEGQGSRMEARDSGFATRFSFDDIRAIPTRRTSMFDFVRAAPGISPTSPTSGSVTTVSAFGSGTNENQFLIDGTNTTCPCNGIARAELGIDFIQEVQVQSVGASVEFGNVQGAVINVITRQGGARFQAEAAYYGQWPELTSQPLLIAADPTRPASARTGYERNRYRDLTTSVGGPLRRDRLWFFTGYQYLRDYDSQPGSDPALPRKYQQDKVFAKLTWRLAPGLQLMQSLHRESWENPDTPTLATPFEATRHRSASVPAITFAHVTHTVSPNTVWDIRVGRFAYTEEREPSTRDRSRANRIDRVTGVSSGAPPQIGGLTLLRTNAKAAISHYRAGVLGADHQMKLGGQVERGEQHGLNVIPTGVRFVDSSGAPFQAISSEPSNTGGVAMSAAAFASDAITLGQRLTANIGMRFEHSRAISQDLPLLDLDGRETGKVVRGLGTMYAWNVWMPRVGMTARLDGAGRTVLRVSYGRFAQGVFTGELTPFHPGVTTSRIQAFDAATGGYTRLVRVIDPRINLQFDRDTRAPHTDEFAAGLDREVGDRVAIAVAYIHKQGADFIGWRDVGGRYREEERPLADGRRVRVFVLENTTADQRFLLTNPAGYSLAYRGLVTAIEKRRSHGWQAFGSYTFSRAYGLQASSGEVAAGAQASTIATPTRVFGRDPNDLTNARGRLPNDRPHMFRLMGALDIPRTGVSVAANLQHFSGKPWAATAQVVLPQGDQRILLEARGSRRLQSQTLLDVRLSKRLSLVDGVRLELLVDVLNALNDTAGEGLASDDVFSPNFGQPTIFLDPRRVMIGARVNLGR